MARQKRLGKTLPTRLRSYMHFMTRAQLLLPKSMSWQLVLVQAHLSPLQQQDARCEAPSRRE